MSGKKDILSKSGYTGMVNGDNTKPDDLSQRRCAGNENYQALVERTMCGEPSFDAFVAALYKQMQTYDNIDPFGRNPLKPITDQANIFLRKHANICYSAFLRQADPEAFTENDFGALPNKKNLKRRLFDHRAMLYLAALHNAESQGHDIDKILQEVRTRKIPYIKKEVDEPTFREILRVLGKSD